MSLTVVAIVVAMASALPATASAQSIDFRTPGRATYCDYAASMPIVETVSRTSGEAEVISAGAPK